MDVRRATPDDEAGILALATRTLGWEDDDRFAALYRWKHDENAFGPSPRWVAVDGDRIIGFRVLLRWRFRRGDEVVTAVRAVDTATDPEHQGRGIFRTLTMAALDELRAEGVGFVFNTPNDQSRPGYLKMGWVELGRPPVAVVPRVRSLARTARARTAAEIWSEPASVGRSPSAALSDPRVVALLERRSATRWSTDRDEAFLRWRFGLPDLHYRVLTDSATDPTAALVVRLRRRGQALEATVGAASPPSPTRRRLLRRLLRETGADHVLLASRPRVDGTPAIGLPALSPLVTWRSLVVTDPPALTDVDLDVGDLELF